MKCQTLFSLKNNNDKKIFQSIVLSATVVIGDLKICLSHSEWKL